MLDKDLDIRVVFNKVVPAFSSIFLFRFYNSFLREEFNNRELLAIYPLEVYLTKAFENTPYLTTVYPQSQLATKTRLVLYALFGRKIKTPFNMAWLFRVAAKYYMGRMPAILNLEVVPRALGIYAALAFGMPYLAVKLDISTSLDDVYHKVGLRNNQIVLAGFALLVIWFIFVIIINWTRDLERMATFFVRTSAVLRGIVFSGMLTVMWATASVILGGLIKTGFTENNHQTEDTLLTGGILGISLIAFVYLLFFAYRGATAIFYEKRYVEGALRICFSIVMLAIFVI